MNHPLEKPDFKSASPLTICEYFITKFTAIPEHLWQIGNYGGNDIHCALGHCGNTDTSSSTEEARALGRVVTGTIKGVVWSINDGDDERYKHIDSPRQRVLAALQDVKSKLLSELPKPEKEENVRTVYVTVDEKVRELQKEKLNCN